MKTKKLSDYRKAYQYTLRVGWDYIARWPLISARKAYRAGLLAGRREKP
jgi:hypothetical protein